MILLLIAMAACQDGRDNLLDPFSDGSPVLHTAAAAGKATGLAKKAATVSVDPSRAGILQGESKTIRAVAYDKRGRALNGVKVVWGSTNEDVATVEALGNSAIVTGISNGDATITAKAGQATGTASIDVSGESVPNPEDAPSGEAPTARFGFDCRGLQCDFDGTGSTDDGQIVEYQWSFGDGSAAQGPSPSHVYDAEGSFTVRLTVTDDQDVDDATQRTVTVGSEAPPPPPPTPQSGGIWMSRDEIANLPMSGSAWNRLKSTADSNCGSPDLANQDDDTNVCILAKALVYARMGGHYGSDVVAALRSIATSGHYSGRALALGRELGAYVIAADLIDLPSLDSSLDSQFRSKLRELRTAPTSSGPDNLVECHEVRANNWGTHCGATRAAIAAYLGDTNELDRVAQVFKGWLGDRGSYAGFDYGDLSWQCDPQRPVGINPAGCSRNGHSIDGVLPDDQRRNGGFSWPPPKANYVWGGLAGAIGQAIILHRAGYDVLDWEDRALLRAVRWLHDQANFPATGDDEWQPHIFNYFYGTSFPASVPAQPGKNLGWTDWVMR